MAAISALNLYLMHRKITMQIVRKQNSKVTTSFQKHLALHADWLQHRLTPFRIKKNERVKFSA
jgi:hypothetical protein